jgi:hypothetical protein
MPNIRERGTGFDSRLRVEQVGSGTWRLTAPLVWTGTQGDTFTVPEGFVTDFATVPRVLVWKTLPYGAYTRAAVLHDFLLVELARWSERVERGEVVATGTDLPEVPLADSHDCDGIFRRVMEDLGVPWLTRWEMWAAVRLASCFSRRRAYGRFFWSDAPKVFGIMALAAVPTLIGVIGPIISLAISRPFTGRAR